MPARKKSSSKGKTRRGPARGGASRARWTVLAIALLAVVAGIGVLNWARTDAGRARLLRLGADRFRGDVQAAVDGVLAGTFEGYTAGPVAADAEGADPTAHDWPFADAGPDAAVRCRIAAAPEGLSLWEVQAALIESLSPVGGEVLWGERLRRPAGRWSAGPATDGRDDLLRLDLGVPGAATHTLVIHPAGTPAPSVRWGADARGESMTDLLGPLDAPTVAVVVDDWGNAQNETTRGLLRLDIPLTLSILPGQPHSRHYALKATELALPAESAGPAAPEASAVRERLARGCPVGLSLSRRESGAPPRKRREVMLHLPMEPQGYPALNPGDRFVNVGMSRRDIATLVDASLASLPGVRGVNNHMGSAATADEATMSRLMAVLGKRGLFFLDSMTTSRSVGVESARRAGLPVLANRLFLDQQDRSREQVRDLLARLVRAARATGSAVGICHPYPETLAILAEELPRYRREGVRFVTTSEMLALLRERDRVGGAIP